MSSVSSFGSSSYTQRSLNVGGQRNGGPVQRLENELASFLEAGGIGADEQKAIKSEIKEAIASSIRESGRPDPSAFKEIVQGVLDKHGLKGEDFTSTLPTFGLQRLAKQRLGGQIGPLAGPPPVSAPGSQSSSSSTSSSEETTKESFIEKLLDLLKSRSGAASSSNSKAVATPSTTDLDLYA